MRRLMNDVPHAPLDQPPSPAESLQQRRFLHAHNWMHVTAQLCSKAMCISIGTGATS
jgi:hypothetical protein